MTKEQYTSLLEGQPLEDLRVAITILDDQCLSWKQKRQFEDELKKDPACKGLKITSLSLYNRLKATAGKDTRKIPVSQKDAHARAVAVLLLFNKIYNGVVPFQDGKIYYHLERNEKGTVKYRFGMPEGGHVPPILFRFHYWRDAPRSGSGLISTGQLRLNQEFDNSAFLVLTYKSTDIPGDINRRTFEGTWENRDRMVTVFLTNQLEGFTVGTVILYFRIPLNENLAGSDFYCSYIKSHSSSSFPGHPTAGIGFLEFCPDEAVWEKIDDPFKANPSKDALASRIARRLSESRLIATQLTESKSEESDKSDVQGQILKHLSGLYTGHLLHTKNELVVFTMRIENDSTATIRSQRTVEHNFPPYKGKMKIFGRGSFPHYFLIVDSDSGSSGVFPARFIFRIEETDDSSGRISWRISAGLRATMDYERPVMGMVWVSRQPNDQEEPDCLNLPMADPVFPQIPAEALYMSLDQGPQLSSFFLNERNKVVFNDLLTIQRLFPTSGIAGVLPHDSLQHLISEGNSQLFYCYYITYPQDKSMEKASVSEMVANRILFRIWKNGLAEVTYASGTFRGIALYRDSSLFLVFTDTIRVQVLLSVPKPKRINDGQQVVERYNGSFSTVVDDYNRIESRSCVFIPITNTSDKTKKKEDGTPDTSEKANEDTGKKTDGPAWVPLNRATEFDEWDRETKGVISNLQGPLMRGFRAAQSNSGNIPLPRNEEIKQVYFNSALYLLTTSSRSSDDSQRKREGVRHLQQAFLYGFGRNTFRGETIDDLLKTASEEKLVRILLKLKDEQTEVKNLFHQLREGSPFMQDVAKELDIICEEMFPDIFSLNQ